MVVVVPVDDLFALVGERGDAWVGDLEKEGFIKAEEFFVGVAEGLFADYFHGREEVLHGYYCYLNNSV